MQRGEKLPVPPKLASVRSFHKPSAEFDPQQRTQQQKQKAKQRMATSEARTPETGPDGEVHATLERSSLPTTTRTMMKEDDDDEGQFLDEPNPIALGVENSALPTKKVNGNPANNVRKSQGLIHSRSGSDISIPKPNARNQARKHRREYPSSWGFDKNQLAMKRRVMAVFDGPRPLADNKSYVTDLDVQTLKRAEGFLNATEEERGIQISYDPIEEDVKAMLDERQD